jgi:hypothetical protein
MELVIWNHFGTTFGAKTGSEIFAAEGRI